MNWVLYKLKMHWHKGNFSLEKKNMVQNCDFQVRGYSPLILKNFFFADLRDLGHEKKLKKCENDPVLSQCEMSHFFFEYELP